MKKIALMDKFGSFFTEGDNFKYYAVEFENCGCETFQLDPYSIDFEKGVGNVYKLNKSGRGSLISRNDSKLVKNLEEFDVIMDLSDIVDYNFAKNLSRVETLHVNDPLATYRSADKRTYLEKYTHFIPKTVVHSDINELERSLNEIFKGRMIVKDPFGSCGRGIEKIETTDENYLDLLKGLTLNGTQSIVAQDFMHFAHEGSKRVAVIGDIAKRDSYRIIHFYGRKPSEGNWKDNLSQGGKVVEVDSLREDEKELCLEVAKNSGLYAVGLDIMDDLDYSGKRVSRLVETNAVLVFTGNGKFVDKMAEVPRFIVEDLLGKMEKENN